MNPRERVLALVLLGFVVVLGGGFLGYVFYLSPLRDRDNRINALREQVEKREREIRQVRQELPKLERWRQLSLPNDVDLARREYERFLTVLLRESGFAAGSYTVHPPKPVEVKPTASPLKAPVYTPLVYKVNAPASLGRVVTFLERFYHTTMLHQIRTLHLKRTTNSTRTGELEVELTIEALVLTGPPSTARPAAYAALGAGVWAARPANRTAISGLATPARAYDALAAHNVFLGPPPPPTATAADRTEVARYIFLTGITRGPNTAEASFFNRYNNRRHTVSSVRDQDVFPILEDSRNRTLVEGVVMRVDERDLYFRVQLAADLENSREPARWSRPDAKTLELLKRDENNRPEDIDRAIAVSRTYWDQLESEELVTVRDRTFAFRWDLVRGRVLRTDDRVVVLSVDEKHCAYAGSGGTGGGFRRRRVSPHEGYFVCHVGESLDEAMGMPLSEEQVKELKAAALPKPAEDGQP